jgi:hypothetical protein
VCDSRRVAFSDAYRHGYSYSHGYRNSDSDAYSYRAPEI